MHDPNVVAFEIPRPWPRHYVVGAEGRRVRYWPALVVVWHVEPGGHDSGTVCRRSSWAWHVNHWRIQVPSLQALRRRLLTRCAWCHGPSRRDHRVDTALSRRDDDAPWWRGEAGLYHGACTTTLRAHTMCLCDFPALPETGYGRCAGCSRRRAWGETPERVRAARLLVAACGIGEPPTDAALSEWRVNLSGEEAPRA